MNLRVLHPFGTSTYFLESKWPVIVGYIYLIDCCLLWRIVAKNFRLRGFQGRPKGPLIFPSP